MTWVNKWGKHQTETGWLDFTYELGFRMHSNEPKCYAGDHLTSPEPTCELKCGEQQCLLMNPLGGGNTATKSGNRDNRRVLATEEAGEDVMAPEYCTDCGTLPLSIPTISLKQGTTVPAKLL